MKISDFLALTKSRGASDLHLSVGMIPTLRINGKLERLEAPELTREAFLAILGDVLTDAQRAEFDNTHDLDLAIEDPAAGRFRVNIFAQRNGGGIVMRRIGHEVPTLDALQMPPVLKDLVLKDRGMILVTGPTGSGKSTTLAAMVDHINTHRQDHIITVEDPIEFVHQPKRCNITQREVGHHTKSFATALRAALREDPDVILVGEMRDLETISQAVTAAETGHLVLATLHTNSAAQTISRIIDVFPPHEQEQIRAMLSDALLAVVAQTLIPALDGTGRVAAVEVMVATSAVRNLIRERKLHQLQSVIQTGAKDGMQSLDQHLKTLVKLRRISQEEALKRATEPDAFPVDRAASATPVRAGFEAGFESRRP